MIFEPVSQQITRDFLAPMAGSAKIADGFYSIEELINGAQAYLMRDERGDGAVLFTINKFDRENGRELVITAARQLTKKGDLTEKVLPEIERQFGHDCQMMTIYTRRPGLVRKLQKAGYYEAAKIMRKKLK